MHREGSSRSGERELVHRLVLTAFVRPAQPGEQACHRNGDPSDNRLSNLYWGTQQANWQDRIRHGNGRSYAKLTPEDVAEIRRRCAAGESAYRVAQDYPVSDTQVRNIIRGDHWATAQPATVARKPCRAVLESVWLGVSVENQRWADIRIPALVDTPATVRWLSCEPLLGPVDIHIATTPFDPAGIDWVVVGGESGCGARPMHPDWARSIRDYCTNQGIPFFFKQWGGRTPKANGRELDGRVWNEYPVVMA
jgi:protein gp37